MNIINIEDNTILSKNTCLLRTLFIVEGTSTACLAQPDNATTSNLHYRYHYATNTIIIYSIYLDIVDCEIIGSVTADIDVEIQYVTLCVWAAYGPWR